ncbi:MAG: Signal recognition particle GTPase Ffh [Candidatus Methanohalarchaeum thermophilum]|uniref:Signal recognition particle 54 kDa protein n=1 Tax=Methanohalarchaeum thermophilum TaxID=1903181 RepID=A0A1Q6DXW4_METT1|nr:MAG: Signal recognition particle GTPase Ffh [Candidatus Methanohalarchaeum thermophilum]
MVLDKLGSSLKNSVRKIVKKGRIDKETVNELATDIQRALLKSDVDVELVQELTDKIKDRALNEEPPKGASSREHVIRIVYEEMLEIVGEETEVPMEEQDIMLVGLQGSGKTTTAAKLANYFQKKGLKPGLICGDTFRPGAYNQLKELSQRIDSVFYGEKESEDAIQVVKNGLNELKDSKVRIVDTAGRHSLESDLIDEMEQINEVVEPDKKFLVIDASIGKGVKDQANSFNEAIGIDGVIITKLDGTAKGGGALTAVSEAETNIAFLGTGEKLNELEEFEPDSFISRLLGMGDIEKLAQRAEERLSEEEMDMESMMKGDITLKDVYNQLESINKLGPLNQIMSMIPGGFNLPDDALDVTKEKMQIYKIIMDSMTEEEMKNPQKINSSRVERIAKGSGTTRESVNELLKYHKMMKKVMKQMKGGRTPMKKMMKKFMG